ncbi:MAG: primosomal protein N' [Treponema sp.]|jgi:primosomal protein N' (replication factor Y)|nr:primosomal protein N' [Treponema sp.]
MTDETCFYLDIVFDTPLKQSYTYRNDEKREAALGKRAMVPFGRRELMGYIIAVRPGAPDLPAEKIKAVRRVIDKEPVFNEENVQLARWMADFYLCGAGEALAAMIPGGRRAGAVSFDDREPEGDIHELSREQQDAFLGIKNLASSIKKNSVTMAYLYGITGSGKTEVFLRAADAVLQAGKSVIYLVPEISLTHQIVEIIRRRFGANASTLHSGMTAGERLGEWMKIRGGGSRIVTGPRSAVFAPVQHLGLVIIDEEHDASYKSGHTPRYHARQLAMRRCAEHNALLLMGSATPSAEAWKLMGEGRIKRYNLTRRLSGGTLPEISIVSLANTEGCLSRELKEEIRKTALAGRQSILFLNRRGFSYFYHCRDCGYELNCKRCSVSLTYHKSAGRAVCHYCGYQTNVPPACPQCGSLSAGFAGFGTEFIEEEVARTFPDLRVLRADADTTTRKGSLEAILAQFRAGNADILLGTQMVAKGLNFPGVQLVGVVFADTGLHLPDFRAAERTFSLIVQVAGRAGRYFPGSKVIVQTLRPRDPAIREACAINVEGFFESELCQRRSANFPPYTRLIRFTVRSKNEVKAGRVVERLAALARGCMPAGADLLGPAECPVGVQNGNYRRQILLRGSDMGALHRAAAALLAAYEKEKVSAVYVESDVDPVNLL